VLVIYKLVSFICARPGKWNVICIYYRGSTAFSDMQIHVNASVSYVLSSDGTNFRPLPLDAYNGVKYMPCVLG